MLLTLHNLPPHMRYPDVKALIQSKCGAMQIILDNLIQHNKYKKVTVGLADEGDAAIFVRKMNGLFIDGCQLYVEDSRQAKTVEQPYRPNSSQDAEKLPGMMHQSYQHVTGAIPAANMMPVMQMDPNMYNMPYGIYYMPDQNATAVGYNQQSNFQAWPNQNAQVGQAAMGMQGSYAGGFSGPNREMNVCETSSVTPDARRSHSADWDVEPPLKQSRWDDSDRAPMNRDSGRSRAKSPPRANQGKGGKGRNQYSDRNKRNPPEDRRPNDRYQETNRSAGNSYAGMENVSYPAHLYNSRPANNNNAHEKTGMGVRNDFNNPHKNIEHPNPRSKPLVGRPEHDRDLRGGAPTRRSGFSEESRERPSLRQEFSWGGPDSKQGPQGRYNQEPEIAKGRPYPSLMSQPRPSFQQETRRSFGQEPQARPSFEQDAGRGPSGFRQRSKERPNFQQEFPRGGTELHQQPPNTRSEYRDNYNSGMVDELDSRGQRNAYAPAKPWDRSDTFNARNSDRSKSKDRRSRDKSLPSWGFGAEEKRKDHHNQPFVDSSHAGGNFGARPYYEMTRRDASPPKNINRGPRPLFSKEIPPRSVSDNPDGMVPRNQGPRPPGPSQYKTPQHQPRATSFRRPRPIFENRKNNYVSQPIKPKRDNPQSLKSAINKHNAALFQAAVKLGREMLENLQLETKEAKEILKPLKKSIRARLELVLGETMCTSVEEILAIYRSKFPANKDMELFEAVLHKVEKGDEDVINKNLKDGKPKAIVADPTAVARKAATSTQPATSLPKTGSSKPPVDQPAVKAAINKLSNLSVPKDGKVPKYPNADKNLMKQQKQLGKQEYLNEDLYRLPDLSKKVLDEELDRLCKIFEGECASAADEAETTVVSRVVPRAVPEFRKALKLQTVKRVLNIGTNLSIRIYYYGKAPRGPGFDAFLKKYSVIACRKSKRAQFFIASVKSYADYDRVIALGTTNIDGTNISIKPLHLGGSNPRQGKNKVVQRRKEFIQQQIANNSTQDFTIDNFNELQHDFDNKQGANKPDKTKQDKVQDFCVEDEKLNYQDFEQDTSKYDVVDKWDANEQDDGHEEDANFDNIPDDDMEDY